MEGFPSIAPEGNNSLPETMTVSQTEHRGGSLFLSLYQFMNYKLVWNEKFSSNSMPANTGIAQEEQNSFPARSAQKRSTQ